MKSGHFRSLFLLLILNLLIKPFWILGIDRHVQLAVGGESYGLYFALFNFSLWLQIILDPGLHTHTNRTLAHSPSELSKFISAFIPLKLGLAALYFIVSVCLGLVFGYNSHSLTLLMWMLLNQILASLTLYFRANLAGLHKFNIDSIFSVMDRVLMIIFCGMLLWGNILSEPFKIEWYIYAQSIAYGLTALCAFFVVFRYSTFFKPNFDLNFFRIVLKESYPYALLSILMTLYTRIDASMIERMLPDGKVQAGIYASAYRLLDAFNMVALLFATILLPVFTGMIKRKESVQQTVNTTFSLLMVPSFLVALSSYFFKNQLMRLLYHDQATSYTATVFGYLMFTQLAISTIYIYGTLLTANGSIRFLNYVSGAGLLMNIILNLILIRIYGALGAVIATLVTQGIVSVWQMYRAYTIFGLELPLMQFAKVVLFVVLSILSFGYLKNFVSNWMLSMLLLCGINLTFAFLLKLLKPNFFLQLVKYKNE